MEKLAFLRLTATDLVNKILHRNNSAPDIITNSFVADQGSSEQKEMRLIEKLLEINIGMSIVVGGALAFLIIAVVAWRFNTTDYFQKGVKASKPSTNKVTSVSNPSASQPKMAADYQNAPIFISNYEVEPKKIFEAEPVSLKLTIGGQLKKETFGFLPYWMVDKSDELNIKLLTDVAYFGLEVDGDGNIVKVDENGEPLAAWEIWNKDKKLDAFIKKAKKNRTKVHLVLKAFSADNISKLVQSSDASYNFIRNALYLVNSKSLDGINLDFEYIGTPDKKVIDGFSLLVANLNKEMKRQYPKSRLTISTFVDAAANTRIHDVEMLAQNSDALVIMGYDFKVPSSPQAGPIAPMEGYGINLMGFMSSYLEKVASEKLILAVGYYGYDWPVVSNDPSGKVIKGTGDVRAIPYAQLMEATKNTKINWDENGKTPWYSYLDKETGRTRVVHFENTRSLGIKYDFINQKHLRGLGIWALGYDGRNTDLLQLIGDKFAAD